MTLTPKVKVIGNKAGICDGVPSTAALVLCIFTCNTFFYILGFPNPLKMQILGLVDLSNSKLRFCFNSNLFDLNYSSTHIDMHS